MYVKIFAQIYDSSIAENYLVRFVFEDFLILADKHGHVDMTPGAIARRTNVPIDIVKEGIERLSSPDLESRSPEEEGRRIVLLDPHRPWGWRIVNYEQYRNIRDDEARKEYFREHKRMQRAQSKNVLDSQGQSNGVHNGSTISTKAEAEAEAVSKSTFADSVAPTKHDSALLKKKTPKIPESVLTGIYQAYPRHVGKQEALRAIEKAIHEIAPSRDAQWLLGRTRAFAQQRRGEDEQFTPYPATWFNKKRFEDELLDGVVDGKIPDVSSGSFLEPAFEHLSRVLDHRLKASMQ
jgi:hypothetical protein